MSKQELNETLEAIARTRGTATVTGGDYMNALEMLQEINRELSQAIYDDSEKEISQ